MNTLILCHANRFRSALVHAYLQLLAHQHQELELNFRSAGFKEAGRPAGKPIRDVAAELGCSLENHRSRLVSGDDIVWSDLIIHMGSGNERRLRDTCAVLDMEIGFHLEKARCLGEWCTPTRGNIQDFAFIKRDTPEFDTVVRYVVAACQKLFAEVIVPRAIEEQAK